jgi:hypothetical protein
MANMISIFNQVRFSRKDDIIYKAISADFYPLPAPVPNSDGASASRYEEEDNSLQEIYFMHMN